MSQALQNRGKIGHWFKANSPLPKAASADDLRNQFGLIGITKEQELADPDLPSGSDQALPFIRLLRHLSGEEHLDLSFQEIPRCRILRTQRLRSRPTPPPIKARGNDFRVIEDHQIAGIKHLWKVAQVPVLNFPGLPLEVKHPGGGSIRQRLLRNQIVRQTRVNFGGDHGWSSERGT